MSAQAAALCCIPALLVGCTSDPRQLAWTFRFEDPTQAPSARVIEATILTGDCEGDEVVYQSIFPVDGAGTAPGVLGPGPYGLSVRARNDGCAWFVSGCVEVTLPLATSDPVEVLLRSDAGGAACLPTECNDGVCSADDAGPPDTGPVDAPVDAPTDTTVTDSTVADTGPPDTGAPPCVPDGTFARLRTYGAGMGPTALATGDFDDDGIIDLAVGNENSNDVSVLLGMSAGTGTFRTATSYVAGGAPHGVLAGTFDPGADLDLAVALRGDHEVAVLLGGPGGTFGAPTDRFAGANAASLASGDFDSDGVVDLAAGNLEGSSVAVLLGMGDGTFPDRTTHAVGAGTRAVVAVDLDGDGILDLATANEYANNVSVLLGTGSGGRGDGGFAAAVSYAAGSNPFGIAFGDFDGDGALDLAAANQGAGTVSVLRGRGDGTFMAATTETVGAQPHSVSSGDFDGDGLTDLVTANSGASTLSVLIASGGGGFATAVSVTVGTSPHAVLATDVDGDGVLDLVSANFGSANASVLIGQAVCP